jgi:chemotaxis protein MotB
MMVPLPIPDARDQTRSNWLVTFADLIALVLAFFVMLYATQKIERGDWQAMIASLSQSLKVTPEIQQNPRAQDNVTIINPPQATDLAYLQALIDEVREKEAALANIVMHRLDDRLVIALPGDLLFSPGRADPVPGAAARIAVLANLLRNVSNRIDIFGHTDPTPVPGQVFESNWELSLARAEMIAAMMRSAGYSRPLGAFGLADTRYEDLSSITSLARKMQMARRVDLVVRAIEERP